MRKLCAFGFMHRHHSYTQDKKPHKIRQPCRPSFQHTYTHTQRNVGLHGWEKQKRSQKRKNLETARRIPRLPCKHGDLTRSKAFAALERSHYVSKASARYLKDNSLTSASPRAVTKLLTSSI